MQVTVLAGECGPVQVQAYPPSEVCSHPFLDVQTSTEGATLILRFRSIEEVRKFAHAMDVAVSEWHHTLGEKLPDPFQRHAEGPEVGAPPAGATHGG